MGKRLVYLLIGVLALGLSSLGWADVSVPTLFSNHMVLQRGMFVPVWGAALAGEIVTVDFNGQLNETTANENGDWMVTLNPMTASSSPGDMVITGDNNITITDVQVGEVWVGSGQSNMYNPLSKDCDATEAIADSGNYNIRLFNVGSGTPDGTIWEVSNPETSPSFSAVHFYFGRHLAENLPGVPIGLIHSAVSATAIERWATCAGSGGLYLDQIRPLQPYAIQGVTWYQGEWDSRSAKDAEKYYWQLPCLINEWRTDWGQDNFPFYVVQLPRMGISNVHIIRDAELQTALNDPDTKITVNIDFPGSDVHPACKDVFGTRLANLARKFVYGHDVVAQGPIPDSGNSHIQGNEAIIVFNHADGGLTTDGTPPDEWEIAGPDKSYVSADANIVSNTLVVSSSSVTDPAYVRYAYHNNPPNPNLFNAERLPASPIRELALTSGPPDSDPPTPDPMTWATAPYSTSDSSIAMTATTASDQSGVEYYFLCTANGCNDSGWQNITFYEDTSLQPNTTYTYQVQARDKSSNQNATALSMEGSATTKAVCTIDTMHIESIVAGTSKGKYGKVTVTVFDNCGNPVPAAEVTGTFTGDLNEIGVGVTSESGVAVITTTDQFKKPSYTFCINNVIKVTLTYEPTDNIETCESE